MKKLNVESFFLISIIISLAIAPAFALGEGNRNLMLISIMGFSPFIILWKLKKIYTYDILLILFVFSITVFPIAVNPVHVRWSTVIYSVLFCLTFLSYKRLLYNSNFRMKHFLILLKYLIFAYFLMLIIQQFCLLFGLPIINLSNYNPDFPWKLNSLSAEPSHSARIVGLLMYCYLTIREFISEEKYNFSKHFKGDKWVWWMFFWTMITMGSGTAFLFLAIILLKFVSLRNLIPLLILSCLIFFTIRFFDISAVNRTLEVFVATISLDEESITLADHSASIRIVPIFILTKMAAAASSVEFFFGHGIDYVGSFLSDRIHGIPDGFSAGGLLQLLIEYGFFSFSLYILFSVKSTIRKNDVLSFAMWFLLIFMYSVNNQIPWLCIVLLFTIKFFERNPKSEKKIEYLKS